MAATCLVAAKSQTTSQTRWSARRLVAPGRPPGSTTQSYSSKLISSKSASQVTGICSELTTSRVGMIETSVARTPPRRMTSTMVRHSIVSKPSAARTATLGMRVPFVRRHTIRRLIPRRHALATLDFPMFKKGRGLNNHLVQIDYLIPVPEKSSGVALGKQSSCA